MAINEDSIAVGVTGKLLRTFRQLIGGSNVQTEAVAHVDPDDVNAIQKVTNVAPSDDAYGAVVRVAGGIDGSPRAAIAGLSFVETLGALGVYQTQWVETLGYEWLDITVEVETNDAVAGVLESTDAADPNVTPPGPNDVVTELDQTVAGTGLGGPANVVSFGVKPGLRWHRLTVTDATGGQTIKVRTYGRHQSGAAGILPLAGTVTPDFGAPLHQSVIRAFDPAHVFQAVRFSGVVASQSSTANIAAAASFTGSEWVDTTGFVGVGLFLKSNANSATDGVILQTSFDNGVTVHDEDPRTYDAGPDAVRFKWSIPTPGAKVRLKITAGGSDMTAVVCKFYLLAALTEDVSVRLDDTPSGDMVGDVVKSQIIAKKEGGGWTNILATALGWLGFSVQEHGAPTPVKALDGGGTVTVRSVGTTASQLDTSKANRCSVSIKVDEDAAASLFYGYSNAVTTSNGFRLSPGESKEWDYDEATQLWGITTAGTVTVYVDEASDSGVSS